MSWVRPTAACAMAALVAEIGPASPIFSPANVQCTPASVSLVPSDGSPGHWWDSPQPPAISWLCAVALRTSPELTEYAGRPACARAWLIRSRTWLTALAYELP